MSEWQLITDDSPPARVGVLLTDGHIVVAGWRNDLRYYKNPERARKWKSFDPRLPRNVTHWMPEPEPPRAATGTEPAR